MSDAGNGDYEVGYGKPPRQHQYPKGKSGNAKGRPRSALGLKAELKAELDELVTITEGGRSRRVRKRRLIIKALAAKAAKGNVAAADKLLSLVIQAEGFEDQRVQQRGLSDNEQKILDQFLNPSSAASVTGGETIAADSADIAESDS